MTKSNIPVCNRRYFLLGLSGVTASLAGCSDGGSDGEDIQDSDGDGVIDSEDYAPQDPDVQSESDIAIATSNASESTGQTTSTATTTDVATSEPTPTPTPEPTPTPTPEPTSTETSDIQETENSLEATGLGTSPEMVAEYSGSEVSVQITSESDIELETGKLLATVYEYPDGELMAYGLGGEVTLPDSGNQTYTTQLDSGSVPQNTRLFYQTYFMPEDETYQTVETSDLEYIAPSDPFTITAENRIERDPPSDLPGETSTTDFSRTDVEGMFELEWSGTTDGQSWDIAFVLYKYAYSEMRNEPRGRDYDEYVAVAQDSGVADSLATLVDNDLEDSGITGDLSKVSTIIDWVQSFAYVTDDVYEDYDEYPKFPVETTTEVSGDCEDTSILLASLLQAEPYNYDMVLISPPGHMAVGIYSTDREGTYYTYDGRDYYFIETTGSGWGIGDVPEDYVGSSATIYQV
jgi:hypothetical protein